MKTCVKFCLNAVGVLILLAFCAPFFAHAQIVNPTIPGCKTNCTFAGVTTTTGHTKMTGLVTTGTISAAICTDASGNIVSNTGANCYAGGGGSPGGNSGDIQFNQSGAFQGTDAVMWDDANSILIMQGSGGASKLLSIEFGEAVQIAK